MKRSPMNRGTGFRKPELPPRVRPALVPRSEPARATARIDTTSRMSVPLPKRRPARSEAYRRLVAAMPCAHCGRPLQSQCAHSDEGKGLAIKSDDRACYPLCADAPGRRGCHSLIGASGKFTREQRRALETRYAKQTRAAILAFGKWPADLPKWED